MTRLANAIDAIRDAVVTVSDFDRGAVFDDDDLVDDLALDRVELESLGLILEEVFALSVPDELWSSPLYRTPASLAEWCIRHSDDAAWREARRVA